MDLQCSKEAAIHVCFVSPEQSLPHPCLSFNHMHMAEDNVQQLRNEAEDQSLADHSEMLGKITDNSADRFNFN